MMAVAKGIGFIPLTNHDSRFSDSGYYFLSSALMEPEDGERHYTETLVRLPNLSIHYQPPDPTTGTLTRASLGLRPETIVYLCCQSLFKYHPAARHLCWHRCRLPWPPRATHEA